jgi:hypothetical protein
MDGTIRPLAGGCLRDKRAPVEAAIETEKQVIAPFCEWKHNGRPAGNGWNRSTNNARFGTDYFNRTGTAKSNMVVAGSYSRQGEWPPILFHGLSQLSVPVVCVESRQAAHVDALTPSARWCVCLSLHHRPRSATLRLLAGRNQGAPYARKQVS